MSAMNVICPVGVYFHRRQKKSNYHTLSEPIRVPMFIVNGPYFPQHLRNHIRPAVHRLHTHIIDCVVNMIQLLSN